MLLYLDPAYEKAKREGKLNSPSDLRQAILYGAVKRIRLKFMTVATTFISYHYRLSCPNCESDFRSFLYHHRRNSSQRVGDIYLRSLNIDHYGL